MATRKSPGSGRKDPPERKVAVGGPKKASTGAASKSIKATKGHVYVVQKTGIKAKHSHVAKKATAGEIRSSIGISEKTRSSAKSLLRTLERDGLISKA